MSFVAAIGSTASLPSPADRSSQLSSSAASFHTAPSTFNSLSPKPSSSRSSSAATFGPTDIQCSSTNPIHIVATTSEDAPQEVHIIKVTDEAVHMQSTSSTSSIVHKATEPFLRVVARGEIREGSFGPPPPSPPASDGQPDEDQEQGHGRASSAPIPPSKSEPISIAPTYRSPRLSFSSSHNSSLAGPGPSTLSRRFRADDSPILAPIVPSRRLAPLSTDGLLQPPSLSTMRPPRRNTTGSAPRSPRTTARAASHLNLTSDDGELSEELVSDIQQQAEQIRRERLSKRVKQVEEIPRVLVGNLIGEGHVNYVLMYNMLTGIRIAVSRTQAKIKRTLTDDDFTARHKYSFDIIGNELTPSARYDFKFKDYAPWVFRELREDHFHLDPADYLLSLTAQYILSELGSPGKSGSFFYFSRDYRFIIKTIRHAEHKFLRSILKRYHAHVAANPHTLLSRFYGLHRVKLPRGHKIHFVIMNNLFPAHKDIHETYDLKGSTVGRLYPEDRARENPRAVLKDLNWIDRRKELAFGPEKRALLTEQLRRDAEFLKELQVMDYSLLVGIHNMQRGNRDNVRRNTLRVFSPDVHVPPQPHAHEHKNPHRRRTVTSMTPEPPHVVRRAMHDASLNANASLKSVGDGLLPEEDTGDRQHFLFSQDEGGLRATDEQNEPLDTVYYLGVIDILTPYGFVKKFEHIWKGMSADRHKISPVPPAEYGDRFFAFMRAIMRGGEGGARFKAE
ncbi:SAICAR synthase-like protein [Lactarius akahatsu]|uniref:1-phosphatidylinositol-4-phosphate 5-kinase n=1 Tax=Lactarius akahatsu TaxID=416441 RepID=A0AAD4LC99_9AGAM|nr:SAICAR synthase-like protein [Lactarius akahatsu]